MTNKNKPVVAITGAGGFLGSTLVSYFSAKNWQVKALLRSPGKYKNSANVTYAKYDLTSAPKNDLLAGVDYLIHAAYVKQDAKNPGAFDVNVTGAQNLLAASRQNKIKKSVFISSMSSHEAAVSSYGRQKLEIEKLFDQPSGISLRLGMIIGNGGIVKDMAEFMKTKHLVPLVGGGKQPLQIVNVQDVGKSIEAVFERNINGKLTIANPRVYSYKQFYKTLAGYLEVKVLFIPMPYTILLLTLRAADMIGVSLSVTADSLMGLKKLTAADNAGDLELLDIKLDDLQTSLESNKFL